MNQYPYWLDSGTSLSNRIKWDLFRDLVFLSFGNITPESPRGCPAGLSCPAPGRSKKIVECKGACQISNSETSFFNVNEFFSEFVSIDF